MPSFFERLLIIALDTPPLGQYDIKPALEFSNRRTPSQTNNGLRIGPVQSMDRHTDHVSMFWIMRRCPGGNRAGRIQGKTKGGRGRVWPLIPAGQPSAKALVQAPPPAPRDRLQGAAAGRHDRHADGPLQPQRPHGRLSPPREAQGAAEPQHLGPDGALAAPPRTPVEPPFPPPPRIEIYRSLACIRSCISFPSSVRIPAAFIESNNLCTQRHDAFPHPSSPAPPRL